MDDRASSRVGSCRTPGSDTSRPHHMTSLQKITLLFTLSLSRYSFTSSKK
ncbi:hypothetical protein PHMEG_00011507 [Phytophthora megakarya]|uniref:Uncharacterized protein n=1 Tax=Phytophthora megakarya TaxID=4795 RepID=A0A225WBJ1_9STRA|nr:hypothetical protein PHMEG_00011507 [Phytophthora megakarya]